MKRIRMLVSACLILALLGGAWAGAQEPEEFTLGIYTTTDMSGKCYDEDPLSGEKFSDSYLKVASAMEQERKNNDATLLLDNGGFYQGTSITWCNMETKNGEENPLALSLRCCGYDAVSLSARELFTTKRRGRPLTGFSLKKTGGTPALR